MVYASRHASIDATAANLGIEFVAGDDFTLAVLFQRQLGDTEEREIIDVSEWDAEAYATVDRSPNGRLDFWLDDEYADEGIITLYLPAEETATLRPGTYRWRLRMTAPGEISRTWLAGAMGVKAR
jgi:hypothetical protein